MTFLTLMNNILRRLREPVVTTVSQNTYSTMVGDFINDAKRQVEMAWDWSGLRKVITITTDFIDPLDEPLGYLNSYALLASGKDPEILSIYNTTSKIPLKYQPRAIFTHREQTEETLLTGEPQFYTFDGEDADGDTKIKVYPTPNGVYTITADVYARQADLAAGSDVLLIPAAPVLHTALAMLARERGEVGGQMALEYFVTAQRELGDAIAKDAAKHPEELEYNTYYQWTRNCGRAG